MVEKEARKKECPFARGRISVYMCDERCALYMKLHKKCAIAIIADSLECQANMLASEKNPKSWTTTY